MGNKACLSSENLNLPKAQAHKLMPNYIGPCEIISCDREHSHYTLMKDMAGHPQSDLINHFTNLPCPVPSAGTGVYATQPSGGMSTADTSPLPSSILTLHEDASTSASSLLHPPMQDDQSSSASSRGSKRRCGLSPQPSRVSHRPSTRA